jgi:MtN3 and saliva related transmembrane protein
MISSALGVLAATASVISFVPQAWKVVRTRKTEELATGMWILNVCGFALWTSYGVTRGQWAIIVPNAICLVFATFILVMKLVSSRTKHAIADKLDPAAKP